MDFERALLEQEDDRNSILRVTRIDPDGADGLVAVLFNAYFDESGTHGKDVTVLTACVGTEREWVLFGYPWTVALEAQGLTAYHGRELGWKSRTNQEFVRIATPIIQSGTSFSLTVALRNADHTRYKKDAGAKQYHYSHYGLCFHIALAGIMDIVAKRFPDSSVSFVLSDGDPHAGDALRVFQSIKDGKIEGKPLLFGKNLGGIAFKSGLIPLQAADLICGVAYHDFLEGKFRSNNENRRPQHGFRVLLDDRWYAASRKGMAKVAEEKKRKWEAGSKRKAGNDS